MTDFVLAAALAIASVLAVRRLRSQGFAGLRPPLGFLASVRSMRRKSSEVVGEAGTPEDGTPDSTPFDDGARKPRRRTPFAAFKRLAAAGPTTQLQVVPEAAHVEPATFIGAWLLGIALVIVAILLQRELWTMRGGMTPLWGLLAIGVAFAIITWRGLQVPDAQHSGPIGVGASRVDPTGEPLLAVEGRVADLTGVADAESGMGGRLSAALRGARSAPGWQFIAGAVLMELVALAIWAGTASSNFAWVLHLAAGPAFLYGVWRTTRSRLATLRGTWSSTDTVLVFALCLLGLLPRVWQLGTVPEGIWFDEGLRGIEALQLAADPNYRPVFVSEILQEPTAFWYLMVPFLQVLGRDPLALRLPSAIAGAIAVGAVYLLARVLLERRTALVAAGLTVGMTWHMNFSRVAFPAMWSVMLDTLAAALFVLALRRRSAFAYAAAGLIAGAAVHFYYSSRLLPLILAIVVVYRLVAERSLFVRQHALGLGCCALGFFLAAAPIGEYALLHPQEFAARTDTVSVLNEVEQAGSWDPLINSTKAHLLMFNFHGDNNGRHNWTGRPMLDSVMGALFVLGLGVAITRWRRWPYALVLAWVPIMLVGGTLSLSWEAPQSHRAVEEVTAVAILAALPLSLLWRAADAIPIALGAVAARSRRLVVATSPSGEAVLPFGGSAPMAFWTPAGGTAVAEPPNPQIGPPADPPTEVSAPQWFAALVARGFGIAVIGLVVAAGILNIQRYFGPQMHDNRTWLEFSTPQTVAGRMINDVPSDWKIYVDPAFLGNPSLVFMIRGNRQLVPFDPAHMPMAEPGLVLLSNWESSSAGRVARFYPDAERRVVDLPRGDEAGLYGFMIAPEDVQESQGVMATYRVGATPTIRREGGLDFDRATNPPVPAPFAATVETTLVAPAYGSYRFRLEAPADAVMILDGAPITRGGADGTTTLAQGVHALRIEVAEAGGAPVRLLWAQPNREFESVPASLLHVSPVRATGLVAHLYEGSEPTGQPVNEKMDPDVDLKAYELSQSGPYTIEWTGSARAHRDGVYRFGSTGIDSSMVWIDGQQVVENRRGNAYVDGTINLPAGWHDIRVRFVDQTSFRQVATAGAYDSRMPFLDQAYFTRVALYWEPPDGGRAIVPTDALRPWRADRVMLAQPEDMDLNRQEVSAQLRSQQRRVNVGGVRMVASPTELVQPRGVAVTADGTVYVADAGRPGIFVVPPNGEPRPIAEGQFKEPVGIAVLPDRSLVVLDAGAAAAFRMQPDGTGLERIFGEIGLFGPRGIATAGDGTIAIADTGNNRIVLGKIGEGIQTVGNLREPTDAAFLRDGNLVAADTGSKNFRVVRRNSEVVASWPMPTAFTVVGPHVAVLPSGGWVATAPEAKTVLYFPANGRSPETWDLGVAWQKPVGIAASRAGVVIADPDAAAVILVGLP
jgi:hypothetical protein